MKRKNILIATIVVALVTLACSPLGLTGNPTSEEEVTPEVTQPESGDEQPTLAPASGGEQPTSPPAEPGGVPEIAGLDTLDSYRVQITWRGENETGSESYEMNILEEYVKEPPARHLVMSFSEGSESTPFMETIQIGDVSWMNVGGTWIKSDTPDDSAMGEDMADAWGGLMTDDIGDMTLAGEETVNGIRCKHYTTGGETTITVPDPEEGGTVEVSVEGEMWVADQAGMPAVTVRQWAQMEGGFFPMPAAGAGASSETTTMYWEYNLTDINAPITIEPPE